MAAYYNEFNPPAAHMLRQLIADGLIAAGDVDERSIVDVQPSDLKGYDQCHFFAGIGGWSVALRLAGWDDARPVWTGSCPCQPFSSAGKQKGKADERHLWPVWFRLIRECRPAIVFGEQVAAAIAHGWWDDVANDMESEGYACGAAVLPACSVGFPHKRDRLWFVANSTGAGFSQRWREQGGEPRAIKESERLCFVGNSQSFRSGERHPHATGSVDGSHARQITQPEQPDIIAMGNPIITGLEGLAGHGESCGGGYPEWINCHARSLWLTPSANEDAAGTVTGKMQKMLTHQAKEAESNGLNAQMEKAGQLNVEFVCWLMGYSTAHLSCMRLAMQSYRKLRRNSSNHQEKA